MIYYLHALTAVARQILASKIKEAGGKILLLVHPLFQDIRDQAVQDALWKKYSGQELIAKAIKVSEAFANYMCDLQGLLGNEQFTVVIVFEAVEEQLMALEAMFERLPSMNDSIVAQKLRAIKETRGELLSVRVTEHISRLQEINTMAHPIIVVPTRAWNSTPYRATWEETIVSMRELDVRSLVVAESTCILDHRGKVLRYEANGTEDKYGCINEVLERMRGKFDKIELAHKCTQFRILPAPP